MALLGLSYLLGGKPEEGRAALSGQIDPGHPPAAVGQRPHQRDEVLLGPGESGREQHVAANLGGSTVRGARLDFDATHVTVSLVGQRPESVNAVARLTDAVEAFM